MLAPGFVDLHVHGGGGSSLITTDPEQIRSYARWVVRRGVTSFLATVCADSVDAGIDCARAVSSATGSVEGGANVLGLNLEGPFVSPDRSGALPHDWLAKPDLQLLGKLLAAAGGTLRLMTVAPELLAADAVVEEALKGGVSIAVGHTDATYDQAVRAFAAGASHVTHAFNAMRPMHHREPGPIGAALDAAGVTVEVIADGVHLHPAAVRMLVQAFGAGRICLVTDGVRPAGLKDGAFEVGGAVARLDRGSIRLPDGTIAGSAATMDSLVRNVVTWSIVDAGGAVRMASATPAVAIGLGNSKGVIEAGYDADIVALDPDLRVVRTWVAGNLVYDAGDKIDGK
jgi:N-acetylglucosamine-6-phosphate deacetylase